ncbi:hypothetical protein CDD82_1229 [Ophiocordyceps australis]|uniref:Ubiquitin carboxyl-terminal hydrolase n=1 Tax=Ophiocordyceps australis TaxID=1399860 RepID=A0A2C5YJJ7_9HYPO|nr:hypothetical protein CDD82_1229 [Ophiocordyceps australis]
MQDKSTTVLSYAAGASLAAVALIYVFGPTFALDHEASGKKTIIGLQNQANDCFINSVLQALAGLGDLRIYLIRETHRRSIQDPGVYANLVQPRDGSRLPEWRLQGLQDGIVTQGLKDMLDALNERPIARKSISPFPFVRVLETAFRQRISRQQQDAQEFLQIVAERLKDEYHAGERARQSARMPDATGEPGAQGPPASASRLHNGSQGAPLEAEDGFPMEGKYESHVQCQTCRYKTKPKQETFCTLTLAVPHASSASLLSCFDAIFKTEYINDFKCEMCRLLQTKATLEHELARSTSEAFRLRARDSIDKLRTAIETDPENPPTNVQLADMRYSPKRTIAKTTRMTVFPKILALHLSRSIYGAGQTTVKNSAKVAFPEQLTLGGLADQHRYRLLAIITHQGGHNSGHYEAFRRQNQPPPYPNPNTFQPSGAYSKAVTPSSTPDLSARAHTGSPAISTSDLLSATPGPADSSRPSLESSLAPPRSIPEAAQSDGRDKAGGGDANSLRSVAASTKSALSRLASPARHSNQHESNGGVPLLKSQLSRRRRKSPADKWWRVSDEKVREAKTSEVLDMQREVYMLFYELDEPVS